MVQTAPMSLSLFGMLVSANAILCDETFGHANTQGLGCSKCNYTSKYKHSREHTMLAYV